MSGMMITAIHRMPGFAKGAEMLMAGCEDSHRLVPWICAIECGFHDRRGQTVPDVAQWTLAVRAGIERAGGRVDG